MVNGLPPAPDPFEQYRQYHGSDWWEDLPQVGMETAAPWWEEATGQPWEQQQQADPYADPYAAAELERVASVDRRYMWDRYDDYLRTQLAQVERLADKAREEQRWQFLEDLAFKREALVKQLAENEKNRRLAAKGQEQEHQARSAALTGYWVGPLGTGV